MHALTHPSRVTHMAYQHARAIPMHTHTHTCSNTHTCTRHIQAPTCTCTHPHPQPSPSSHGGHLTSLEATRSHLDGQCDGGRVLRSWLPISPFPRGQSGGPRAYMDLMQRKEEENNTQKQREKGPMGDEPGQASPGMDAIASEASETWQGRQTDREGWKAACLGGGHAVSPQGRQGANVGKAREQEVEVWGN